MSNVINISSSQEYIYIHESLADYVQRFQGCAKLFELPSGCRVCRHRRTRERTCPQHHADEDGCSVLREIDENRMNGKMLILDEGGQTSYSP